MLYFIFLYCALASPEWTEREAASASLLRLIDRHPALYGPVLERLARDATVPEIRSRVRIPLAAYMRWRVSSFVPSGTPVWPCIDMMPAANPLVPFSLAPDVRDKYAASEWYGCGLPGATCIPDCGPYWGKYRSATERMVRAKIQDGADADEMRRLVSRMWAIENAVKSDCGEKWMESAQWTTWRGYPHPKE